MPRIELHFEEFTNKTGKEESRAVDKRELKEDLFGLSCRTRWCWWKSRTIINRLFIGRHGQHCPVIDWGRIHIIQSVKIDSCVNARAYKRRQPVCNSQQCVGTTSRIYCGRTNGFTRTSSPCSTLNLYSHPKSIHPLRHPSNVGVDDGDDGGSSSRAIAAAACRTAAGDGDAPHTSKCTRPG